MHINKGLWESGSMDPRRTAKTKRGGVLKIILVFAINERTVIACVSTKVIKMWTQLEEQSSVREGTKLETAC